jgi:hypothetical protein
MQWITIVLTLIVAAAIGSGFYLRRALRKIADDEIAERIASEVRRMEIEIEHSPTQVATSSLPRQTQATNPVSDPENGGGQDALFQQR